MSYALSFLMWMFTGLTGAPPADCAVVAHAEASVCMPAPPPEERREANAREARTRRHELAISNGF
jgi:hypothetical protein